MDLSLPLQVFVITEWPGSTCNHPAAGIDWKDEVAKLVDELDEVTVEQAWAALDAAAGSGAAVTSLRAAREGTGWNVGAKR